MLKWSVVVRRCDLGVSNDGDGKDAVVMVCSGIVGGRRKGKKKGRKK